ncbi:MAG: hypothetical protein PR2021_1090 [Candidatus Phytoplasma pruni]|nr:MAG: hypothetical protein PR2021_1090 [Candidatus Phytoplasma pruni]
MNEYLFSLGFMIGSLFTCGIFLLLKKTFFTNHITSHSTNKDKNLEDISLSIKNLHVNHKKDNPQINEIINPEKDSNY